MVLGDSPRTERETSGRSRHNMQTIVKKSIVFTRFRLDRIEWSAVFMV